MKTEIEKLYNVWEQNDALARRPIGLPPIELNQAISSVYSAGPSYYYVIEFFDMSLSHVSPSITEIHGLDPETTTFNDILSLIHPDDMDYVARAESKMFEFFQNKVGVFKFTKYKTCYCFRFRKADGSYKLFLHQSLILTIDEHGHVSKSLNIHTDISHLTTINNNRISFIGLQGEPSYMDMEVYEKPGEPAADYTIYTKREIQIIKLLAEGLSNAEISHKLKIALDTAKNHRRNILKKSGVKNTAELIKKCMLDGLV